jgi:chromate transport protein ChrA
LIVAIVIRMIIYIYISNDILLINDDVMVYILIIIYKFIRIIFTIIILLMIVYIYISKKNSNFGSLNHLQVSLRAASGRCNVLIIMIDNSNNTNTTDNDI